MPSTGCRRVAAIVLGFACTCAAMTGEPVLAAKPRPSAEDVAKARKQVRERAAELKEVGVRLAEARARQEELAEKAALAVEAYNEAVVRAQAAQAEHERALQAVKRADEMLAAARRDAAPIVAESYGGYDLTQPGLAMAVGPGGPEGYLQRTSMLHHMQTQRAHTLQRLQDILRVRAIMLNRARKTHEEHQRALERAEAAKRAAEQAVAEQVAQTRLLEEGQARLERRLSEARRRAERLERRRNSAVTRVRMTTTVQAPVAAGSALTVKGVGHRFANAAWVREALAGSPSATKGEIAAAWALTQLGKPYRWAGAGPHAYDCSGLTMRAWERAGVRLDHWTGTQWTSGPHVPIDRLQRGDLVFFGKVKGDPKSIHHVGIYIGDGLMVHAPRTGDVVRVAPIWRNDLFGATRPAT